MKILALDLGSKLGFASGINEKVTAHGVKNLVKGKWFSNESFLSFQQWAHSISRHVNVIVVERPNSHMPGYHGIRIHFGMYGILQSIAAFYNIPIIPISATTVKKFWTGDGHARKDLMVQTTVVRGYKEVVDDNESDAIALYHTYLGIRETGIIQDEDIEADVEKQARLQEDQRY